MKTKLYLIRHGEVENPKDIVYQRLPGFPLSEKGERQILELSKKIKDKNITKIYASPLLRTKQTARILSCNLGSKKIPIRYSDKLIESNYIKWQGLKHSERPQSDINGLNNDPVKYTAILGESIFSVQKRVVDELYKIAEKHKGENIAVVFHADPILSARMYFDEIPMSRFMSLSTNHASVTSIILDDELKCEKVEYKEYVKADGWRK